MGSRSQGEDVQSLNWLVCKPKGMLSPFLSLRIALKGQSLFQPERCGFLKTSKHHNIKEITKYKQWNPESDPVTLLQTIPWPNLSSSHLH